METAVAAMRAGAYDFLTKPIDVKLLGLSVARAVEHHRLQEEVKRLREESLERSAVDELIGTSPAMKRVHDLVARVGASDISVLIEGETGTGKELVARALHAAGPRRNGPFVAINCGAVPAEPPRERALWPRAGRLHRRRARRGWASSSRRPAGRCSSTRSATCRWRCRPSCCAPSRRGRSGRWARTRSARSTCASSRRPTVTWRQTSRRSASGRTSTTASTS